MARAARPESGPSAPEVAEAFAALASCVEARSTEAEVSQQIRLVRSVCERAAVHAPGTEAGRLLSNVQQALETWRTVWPRLGAQQEFRAAVVREARLWAKRFQEAAPWNHQ